jgi:hypothetical protein
MAVSPFGACSLIVLVVVRRALRLALVVAGESYSFGDLRQEHGRNKRLASRCSAAAVHAAARLSAS